MICRRGSKKQEVGRKGRQEERRGKVRKYLRRVRNGSWEERVARGRREGWRLGTAGWGSRREGRQRV